MQQSWALHLHSSELVEHGLRPADAVSRKLTTVKAALGRMRHVVSIIQRFDRQRSKPWPITTSTLAEHPTGGPQAS